MNQIGETYREFKILALIHQNAKREFNTLSELAESLDMSSSDPTFRKIIKFFIEEEIIIQKQKIGRIMMFKLNHQKLENFITTTKVYNDVFSFIKRMRFIKRLNLDI